MAEVSTDKGGDKGGKNKQKKVHLRVDFTPMVDMNMLLITFFMFCTSLNKPQSMDINMPSNEIVDDKDRDKMKESTAVTLVLGSDDKIFYYLGKPDEKKYDDPNFFIQTGYHGLRTLLLEKNAGVNREIKALKVKLNNKEITEDEFKKQASDIRREEGKSAIQKQAPNVRIMPSDESTYKNLVDALDEMQICNIATYAIVPLGDSENYLMYTRTGKEMYKTNTAKK